MKWSECSMYEAMVHASRRTPVLNAERPEGAHFDWAIVGFSDGTALAARSEYTGALSEVTPDIDAEDPTWHVFK